MERHIKLIIVRNCQNSSTNIDTIEIKSGKFFFSRMPTLLSDELDS